MAFGEIEKIASLLHGFIINLFKSWKIEDSMYMSSVINVLFLTGDEL